MQEYNNEEENSIPKAPARQVENRLAAHQSGNAHTQQWDTRRNQEYHQVPYCRSPRLYDR